MLCEIQASYTVVMKISEMNLQYNYIHFDWQVNNYTSEDCLRYFVVDWKQADLFVSMDS